MNKQYAEISKFLSFVLRHKPETIGLTLDSDGWANIDALIDCANKSGNIFTLTVLQAVVNTNDKKRFTISENGLYIRAAQGHSTQSVNIVYQKRLPPEFLFHGTATRFLESIKEKGLVPGSRHKVKSLLMYEQGFDFYLADDGVWLTSAIPTKFLCDSA